MSKQKAIDVLREVLNDRVAIERKLNELIRDGHIESYVLSVALTRLENFEDDIRTAIDDIEG